MPYIAKDEQSVAETAPVTVGQLTYKLTKVCVTFANGARPLRFITIALVMGALFCAALEFYRRVGVPYEDSKRRENGDVYD